MRNTQFTSKEEYLAYRSQWKVDYAQLSQDIRQAKLCRNIYQRTFSKAERECLEPGHFINYPKVSALSRRYLSTDTTYQELFKKFNPTAYEYWGGWPAIYPLRDQARNMIEERKASKVRSQEQYLAAEATLVHA